MTPSTESLCKWLACLPLQPCEFLLLDSTLEARWLREQSLDLELPLPKRVSPRVAWQEVTSDAEHLYLLQCDFEFPRTPEYSGLQPTRSLNWQSFAESGPCWVRLAWLHFENLLTLLLVDSASAQSLDSDESSLGGSWAAAAVAAAAAPAVAAAAASAALCFLNSAEAGQGFRAAAVVAAGTADAGAAADLVLRSLLEADR